MFLLYIGIIIFIENFKVLDVNKINCCIKLRVKVLG